MRLAICVPTAGTCKSTFAHSLGQTMACFAPGQFPATEKLALFMQESSVVHSNREALVDRALKWNATHILFLDDDMAWPTDSVLKMMSRDAPFVACNYPKRIYPIEFTAVGVDGQRLPTRKDSPATEEIQYAGFGVCLISTDVFNALEKPWFLPGWMPENVDYTTEDAPLYIRARAAGFIPIVDHEASWEVQHIGLHMFSCSDIVTIAPKDDDENG